MNSKQYRLLAAKADPTHTRQPTGDNTARIPHVYRTYTARIPHVYRTYTARIPQSCSFATLFTRCASCSVSPFHTKKPHTLTSLSLNECQHPGGSGDAIVCDLADACASGALPQLEELVLGENRVGDTRPDGVFGNKKMISFFAANSVVWLWQTPQEFANVGKTC